MLTVASLAGRLDMSAETAVERLRYMFFEVSGEDDPLSDEMSTLLIDIDEDPAVADRVREAKLKSLERLRKKAEREQKAASKPPAKRKPSARAKAKEMAEAEGAPIPGGEGEAPGETPSRDEAPAEAAPKPVKEKKKEAPAEAAPHPRAEILPPELGPAHPAVPVIKIGSAIEHASNVVEIVRADGTLVDVPDVLVEEPKEAKIEEEEEELGLLAEAERRQEEEERRKLKPPARPVPKPDPAVVEEVKRKAAERAQKQLQERTEGRGAAVSDRGEAREGRPVVREEGRGRAPRGGESGRKGGTGKTARKRQKKVEKLRVEESMRRDAAAAVREFTAMGLGAPGLKKRKRKRTREEDGEGLIEEGAETNVIEVGESMTVEELANALEVSTNDIILELMEHSILATKNQMLSLELITRIAEKHGCEVESVIPEESEVLAEEPDEPDDLCPRAPVITVMGHVDHGKTSLLDVVRTANVADGEAGGITQHIAAYDVPIKEGRVVFLDTPGHEAFTQMRARGAKVTDIVVLVIAADDGVMPQTVEAIDHARAAEVPIVVAINKCDKPNAQPDRIRQELTRYELLDEQWGGKTIVKNISAKTKEGVVELMELLLLEAELLELKGNPRKRARGTVVESEITRGLGPVAWVLVQNGTLRVGDVFLAGESYGRVRAMHTARGQVVDKAGPSTPVVVTGFSAPPNAGDSFVVVPDERVARAIAEKRAAHNRAKQGVVTRHITLEDFHLRLMAGEKNELNVVLKADVQGSVDVFESSLTKLGNEEVRVRLVHGGVGGINESDVLLASASDAVVIGFHVTANAKVQKLAEQEGVDIRTYRVIYEAIDDLRRALEGMLKPESREVVTGHAEIRQVFRSSSLGNIAGCHVTDGEIVRGALARMVRDGNMVYDGKIESLRRNRDDARSVSAGFECGIKLDRYEDIKAGDVIEVYRIESIAKTLN